MLCSEDGCFGGGGGVGGDGFGGDGVGGDGGQEKSHHNHY